MNLPKVFFVIVLMVAITLNTVVASPINAGMAISIDNRILSTSKNAIVNYLKECMLQLKFGTIYVMTSRFDGLMFTGIEIDPKDV